MGRNVGDVGVGVSDDIDGIVVGEGEASDGTAELVEGDMGDMG